MHCTDGVVLCRFLASCNYKKATRIGVLLVALYSLLYTILQMEDYALLMGTALLLVMLAALMVVSRNLARGNKMIWYE